MGITKLMHIKERKKGNKAAGLLNCIYYILNPAKTQNKRLVGGNCGKDEEEIYRKFLDTKKSYGKEGGRQGYHFVISFPPEENVSAQTCMNVMSDFMNEYLQDEYDAVFAVHDDTDHMHGHLCFNSVNSITGKKYRYEDGDWEKYIQPVTDRIAERYGLSKLEFVGVDEEEDIDWDAKIKHDIDECVKKSDSYEDFKSRLKKEYGYKLREGMSKKHGLYLSYHPPGKRKAVRSYQLSKQYQPYDIKRRIELREQPVIIVPVIKEYYCSNVYIRRAKYLKWNQMSLYQRENARKIYKARMLYHRGNGVSNWENARISRDINKLLSQHKFLFEHNVKTEEDAEKCKEYLSDKLKTLNGNLRKCRKKYKDFLKGEPSLFELYEKIVVAKEKELTLEEKKKVSEIEDMLETNYVGEVYQEYMDELNTIKMSKDRIKKDLNTIRGIATDLSYFKVWKNRERIKQKGEDVQKKGRSKKGNKK